LATRAQPYVVTWGALVLLTAASFGCSLLRLGGWDVVVSLVIATAKATLVAAVFMHLLEERFASRAVLLVAGILLTILIVLTSADVLTRHTFPPAPSPPRE
jgi:cytochrome c oxidase subunit 4